MLKRIISAMVCLVLISTAFCINAFAVNKLDVKSADVKLYTDKDAVDVGDTLTVTIYLENITLSSGFLAVDFPLTFDRSKLVYQGRECIFPVEWGPYGEDVGHETAAADPMILRSNLDIMALDDYTALAVTKSKVLGFKVTFKAVAPGEAFIAVENGEALKDSIMLVAMEGKEVNNYGANGMTVKVNVTGNAADVSDDSSEDTSGGIMEDSSVADSSVEESSVADSSVEESSAAEASVADSSVSSSANTDNGDEDEGFFGKLFNNTVFVVIAIALGVVILLGGVLFIVLRKKKTKK